MFLSLEYVFRYESCQVSYSFSDFSTMKYQGKYPLRNSNSKTVTNPQELSYALNKLMVNLKKKATSSRNKFGTGELKHSASGTVCGLLQCTMRISSTDCTSCLNGATGDLISKYSYKQSGIVVSRYCNARFELY